MNQERVVKSIDELEGVEKVAVFMLMLSQEQVALILDKLSEDEVRNISSVIASLGLVDRKVANDVLHEFFDHLHKINNVIGSLPIAQRMLYDSLPKTKATLLMETMSQNKSSVWERMNSMSETALASYLQSENLYVVSMILSKLKVIKAGKVLSLLPLDITVNVIDKMVNINNINSDVMDSIEATLKKDLIDKYERSAIIDPYQLAANIFNYLDKDKEDEILNKITDYDPALSERIRALMFTFDDIYRIGRDGLALMLQRVDTQDIALALKGASERVKGWFFDNMPKNLGKMIKEELTTIGNTKLRVIDNAQVNLLNKTREMIEKGEIVLTNASPD